MIDFPKGVRVGRRAVKVGKSGKSEFGQWLECVCTMVGVRLSNGWSAFVQ
jgi:hypothetical protein